MMMQQAHQLKALALLRALLMVTLYTAVSNSISPELLCVQ
jgi:hypothetical protein